MNKQADGEKTCGTCRNEDTYHCAECENKSDYEQAQADGDLTTALCSLPKVESLDGQEYVQLYDVLETVRRYKPSVTIPNKVGHWIKGAGMWICDQCGYEKTFGIAT